MNATPMEAQLRYLLQRQFPEHVVENASVLSGGVSSNATRIDLRSASDASLRVVVRRPWAHDRRVALLAIDYEAKALGLCERLGLPTPRVLRRDDEAAAIILDFVEGAPLFAPTNIEAAMRAMADTLVRIHECKVGGDADFLQPISNRAQRMIADVPKSLDESLDEDRVRRVLGSLWPWSQENPDTLLHGDYWPGNLLWRSEELCCVIDWEEPAKGDALADLAIARLDILWAFGEEAMKAFTARYRERTALNWSRLPHWDLWVALRPMSQLPRWAPAYAGPPIARPDITVETMTKAHHRFVAQAIGALGGS